MNLLSSVLRFHWTISLRLDLELIVLTVVCYWLSVLLHPPPPPPPLVRALLLRFSKLLTTFVFIDTTTLLSEVPVEFHQVLDEIVNKLHPNILTATAGSKKSDLAYKRAICPLAEKTFTVFAVNMS